MERNTDTIFSSIDCPKTNDLSLIDILPLKISYTVRKYQNKRAKCGGKSTILSSLDDGKRQVTGNHDDFLVSTTIDWQTKLSYLDVTEHFIENVLTCNKSAEFAELFDEINFYPEYDGRRQLFQDVISTDGESTYCQLQEMSVLSDDEVERANTVEENKITPLLEKTDLEEYEPKKRKTRSNGDQLVEDEDEQYFMGNNNTRIVDDELNTHWFDFSEDPQELESKVKEELDVSEWESVEEETVETYSEHETSFISDGALRTKDFQSPPYESESINPETFFTPFKCELCDTCFPYIELLRKHKRSRECQRSFHRLFSCNICKKRFKLETYLKEHYITIHNMPHLCDFCGMSFKIENQLKEHLYEHTGISLFQCFRCKKSFKSAADLKDHDMVDHKKESYQCSHCSKTYANKKSLRDHMANHTAEGLLKCKKCDQIFNTEILLNLHKVTHSEVKRHGCKLCGKSFTSLEVLRRHIKTHDKFISFTCPVCGRDFSDKSAMMRHQELHSGEKKYSCEICDKRFFQKQTLAKHKARCHPEITDTFTMNPLSAHLEKNKLDKVSKPSTSTCPVCSRHFANRRSMMRHQELHSNEKKYSCDLCDKKFFQKQTLVKHLDRCHPELKTQ